MIAVVSFSKTTVGEVIEETGTFGELISPGYPNTYPNDVDIQWNITVPEGYQIRLYFTVFDVEYGYNCEYDYVKVIVNSTNNIIIRCP